jgi:hypothetical protein
MLKFVRTAKNDSVTQLGMHHVVCDKHKSWVERWFNEQRQSVHMITRAAPPSQVISHVTRSTQFSGPGMYHVGSQVA